MCGNRRNLGCITNFRFTTGYFPCLWLGGAIRAHRYAQNALLKGFLGRKLFLKIKIFNFYLQKQLRSDRFSLGTPFERSDERESRHQAKGMENSA